MRDAEAFVDTSVLLYLLSDDDDKLNRVEELLGRKGAISVQVLNEFASVAHCKRALSVTEIRDALGVVRALCVTHPLTVDGHERGLDIAERYKFSVYDSMIVASALLAGCTTLYSEDLQHRQIVDKALTILNPFAKPGD